MTVIYRPQNRSKKERQRAEIVRALRDIHPQGASSRTIQDRLYDRLGHRTPNTSAIGRFCHELSAEGWLRFETTQAISPSYTWFYNEEANA